MDMEYKELQRTYAKYFSLGQLETDIGSKFALVSLTCYVTKKLKAKDPDATCYSTLMKIIKNEEGLHDHNFIRGLSIVCEDFYKNSTEFLTFDLKTSKEMVSKIKEILNSYLPF